MGEPLIYEICRAGRKAVHLPDVDVPESPLPQDALRGELPLPEVSEIDLVRHYTRLSQLNHSIDTGFYPLGSCTMKYNPKVNEYAARMAGLANLHPLQDMDSIQGAMALMHNLQEMLAEIAGFAAVTLQPAAGAHGELTGVLIMRKYLYEKGETQRDVIIVPDSAHGTNPATTSMSGLKVVECPSAADGNVDLAALKALIAKHGDRLVGLMLTNPNTLGLFDENVAEVLQLVHEAGGLVYGDGANFNAILGIAKPGALGFDVMHYNLHKTFSTPHGGGGPGSGAVGVAAHLAEYLPGPIVARDEDGYFRWEMPAKSIGRVKAFWGNFGILVRAYTYIRMHGAAGLRAISENAVLNANYIQARLRGVYPIPHGDRTCMHEFVAQGKLDGAPTINTMDIAKRLMDYEFHPPTVYFPLIVPEAIMIEPTETESKETLDAFCDAMIQIAQEARETPELLKTAPHNSPVKRLDEVRAAKELQLCYAPGCS
ncbi:MAG: aminomethyl-transferring glycine dehydrogenase subunit GcvPB [Anaerolineae bacterium]|jgi:glycine dehydrogenase subunit 2|nr:aminomethyl-transferring glycine dehydrogenase subunit GcvPB [Anaerolineae bacterium]